MQHRDEMVCRKIISEIDIGLSMIRGYSLDSFLQNELVKRAVCMTTINIGELVKTDFPMLKELIGDLLKKERQENN